VLVSGKILIGPEVGAKCSYRGHNGNLYEIVEADHVQN